MEDLIAKNDFCNTHNIEISFLDSLQQFGLIEISVTDESEFIHISQLQQLEIYTRLFYDLDINLEGIDTISHLLQRINSLQKEVIDLKNKLRLYEEND